MDEKAEQSSFMIKVATFIVDRRNLFFLLFVMGIVFSLISSGWVEVENSLEEYLPETTETKQGIELMDEEFVSYGTAKIMVTNIDFETADKIATRIENRKDVAMLVFDPTNDHYNNFSALYDVTFIYEEDDERALESLEEIKQLFSDYDIFTHTGMGDQTADIINKEMETVTVIVAVIVLTVLILTSETWAEIPLMIMTFLASAIVASGTNYMLGTISFVSDSVTIVLQLALSIDYAVIFCNRYKEEHATLGVREADIIALSKAIPEISASSLTTVGGLIAMMFMQYGIGPDMGVCLIKAIFFSLLSVFTLMPGLLMIFGPLMDKTKHRSFIPKIPFVGKFDFHTRFIVPPLFLAVVVCAFIVSNKCPYVYGYSTLTTPIQNDIQIADEMIEETFGEDVFGALVIPRVNYETEGKLVRELESYDEVKKIVSLTNTEAMDGYNLTDKLTERQFSELMNIDYDLARLLYTAYAIDDENYGKIVNDSSSYAVPLIDMLLFLYDEYDEGYVTLDDDELVDDLEEAHDQMTIARNQLQGENYSRMLVYLNLPEEGDETFAFIDRIHEIAHKYYEGTILMAGEPNSQYDLKTTFMRDNKVVNWVSIIAVLAVLLFTFMSVGMPILLIIVIQGAIWLNFSYPTIAKENVFFMSYLIVSSIQMGANIDYAIVISGRFMELKDKMSKKDAIVETMNFAFPTIVTSGSMLALAGFAIGSFTSDPSICGIGQCICRGTLISIGLVMFVLPQILLLGEKIIDLSSFKVSVPLKLERETGLIRLDGRVQGNLEGRFIGEIHGVLRGNANVIMATGNLEKLEENQDEWPAGEVSPEKPVTDIALDGISEVKEVKTGSGGDEKRPDPDVETAETTGAPEREGSEGEADDEE